MKEGLLRIIQFYRSFFSPFFGSRCRFHPSCSAYAAEAIEKKGTAKGLWLSAKRVMKCHPFHPGGLDVVR